jgi:hypothetical protein
MPASLQRKTEKPKIALVEKEHFLKNVPMS